MSRKPTPEALEAQSSKGLDASNGPQNHGPDEAGHGDERLGGEVERLRDGVAALRRMDASFDAFLLAGDEADMAGSR